jgi:hypothetical protein
MTTEVCPPAAVLIPLDRIVTDNESQARVKIHTSVVRQYADAMTEQLAEGGLRFPPVVLFSDERDYWLDDGFHRVLAARKAGLTEILAEIRSSSRRDALLHSITSNTTHGLPRSNADKRRAVGLLLADAEWNRWSDREISRRCQVDHKVVSRLRAIVSGAEPQMRAREVQRGDQVYAMSMPVNGSPADDPPKESLPPTDSLGLAVPEPRVPVFGAKAEFEEAERLFERLATIVNHIAQSPAGEAYRSELVRVFSDGAPTFICSALRIARNKLLAIEPYCAYCPNCCDPHPRIVNAPCKTCAGRGWTTRSAFEACPEDARKRVMKLTPPTSDKTEAMGNGVFPSSHQRTNC